MTDLNNHKPEVGPLTIHLNQEIGRRFAGSLRKIATSDRSS
jgi:hypothetical protein